MYENLTNPTPEEKKSALYKEKVETTGDPLDSWHTGERPSGSSLKNEEGFLSEDEQVVFENDPRLKGINVDEAAEESGYNQFLAEFGIDPAAEEDLNDFENQDISIRPRAEVGEEEKKAEKVRTFSTEEFDLMEACSKYKARTALPEALIKHRPQFSPDQEMTDEQVAVQVSAYKECKAKNLWSMYHQDEIEFMKKCSAWNYYYRKVLQNQKKAPVFTDGSAMSEADIEELAREYHTFRTEKPEEFAEMKAEKGEWQKNFLQWQETSYKGKPQWQSYKNENVDGKNARVKYVSANEPSMPAGDFYYVVEGEHTVPDNTLSIKFVNLRYPTARNVQMMGRKAAAVDKEVETETETV